jgi:hypothetical protein
MNDITISLDRNYALVLFELLRRWEDQEPPLPFEDPSELWALWSLQGSLEKTLAEPFQADYDQLLDRARAAVRDHSGL